MSGDRENRFEPESLSATQAEALDQICDRFEAAFRSGRPPRIEDYLGETSEPIGSALLRELIAVEVDHRRRRGECPAAVEYQDRFPGHADIVALAFGSVDPPPREQEPKTDSAEPPDAANGLFLGLLAFQNNLIDRNVLLAALSTWVLDKTTPFGKILVDSGALDTATCALLEALARKHLDVHGGDQEKSLAALGVGGSTREVLAKVSDPDLQATLSRVGAASSPIGRDADRTAGYEVGIATGDGHRFRVLRPHARGGLGAVFVALDAELNREVALKQILDQHADDPVSRQRFVIEAEITGGLEHPGIVPVYGLGSYEGGRPYYAMRFVKGDSLKEAVERFRADAAVNEDPGRRSLEMRQLLRRFLDICNAIDYAHSRGVLHRDIKPGNVIVGKHGETFVVDWGLAKPLGRVEPGSSGGERTLVPSSASGSAETLPGSALGTPSYMSPEQAAGDLDQLGPRSDVYSLGATLYYLLTGRAPFEGDVFEILRKVQAGHLPPPRTRDPSIDRSLEAICLKAMALEPEGRYPTPKALAEDVERWMADEPVSARREPLAARLARWARRHRTSVAAAGLSLVTAVVCLAVLYVQVSSAQGKTRLALNQLRIEQGRTVRALQQAETSFRQARGAVEEYFTLVGEETLLDEPGMQPLREKLLRSALKYHETFLRERQGDPALKADLALSEQRYAKLTNLIGRPSDSLPHLQHAIELNRELVQQNPSLPEHRIKLAECLEELSVAQYTHTLHKAEAGRAGQEAIEIYDQLLRGNPSDRPAREGLAGALYVLAIVKADRAHEIAESLRMMQRAREIGEALLAEQPDSPRQKEKLAIIYCNLFQKYVTRDRMDEALKLGQRAKEIYDELAPLKPASPRLRFQLGWVQENLGLQYNRAGRHREAAEAFSQGRTFIESLVQQNPKVAVYRFGLAELNARLGGAQLRLRDIPAAIDALQKSCDLFEQLIREDPDESTYIDCCCSAACELGRALIDNGRPQEAVPLLTKACERMEALARKSPENVLVFGGLTHNHLALALALSMSGRHEEAIALYRQGLDEVKALFGDEGDEHGRLMAFGGRIGLAMALRALGRDAEAATEASAGAKLAERDPDSLVGLAAYDASGSALVSGTSTTAAARRRQLADQAMNHLHRAIAAGFRDRRKLEMEPDFAPIRARPDFQLLLMDLAMPDDPFAVPR